MRTRIALGALLALAIAVPVRAGTSIRIGVGINTPPPVVAYRHEPRWVMVPGRRVYVVNDEALGYDYFRYGGSYWIYDGGNWFRGPRYNGPWARVRYEMVPAPIWRLGDRERDHYRWRHRPSMMAPEGSRRFKGGEQPQVRGDQGDRGRGHDHDH